MLDQVLPPSLAVGVPGRVSQIGQRIDKGRGDDTAVVFIFRRRLPLLSFERRFDTHLDSLREIHESKRYFARKAELNRLPFGRELRERVVGSTLRVLGIVNQQRNRRLHLRMRCKRQDLVGIGRAFDKNAVRSEEHTSELQSQSNLVCRLLLEKKKT